MNSVLSEHNAIQQWLDTPIGYYVHVPTYGNNLFEIQHKNIQTIREKLDLIMDKIIQDLGEEEASQIQSINVLQDEKEIDTKLIVFVLQNGMIASKEI